MGALLDEIDFNPVTNRGFAASVYLRTIIPMIADGALALDDVKIFQDDEDYRRIMNDPMIPSSDAIGDWLIRLSRETKNERGKTIPDYNPDERKMLELIGAHAKLSIPQGTKSCLDIDTTILRTNHPKVHQSFNRQIPCNLLSHTLFNGIQGFMAAKRPVCQFLFWIAGSFLLANNRPLKEKNNLFIQCLFTAPPTI